MKTRILVAAIGLPLLLVIVLVLPSYATAILVAAMCGLGAYELLYAAGYLRHLRILIYTIVAAAAVCCWSWLGRNPAIGGAAVLVYLSALFGEMLAAHTQLKFRSICVALFAGLVIPYLLGALIRLRCMDNGQFYILVAFLVTMVPDSGAYFIGRAMGKRKLAPIISPNKTVEGAVGGVVCAILGMIIYALILRFGFGFNVNYIYAAIYGLFGAVGSIVGDLFYSCVKRQVKIKDYGNILPGHGGALDRFDSMSVVAPLVEAFMLLIPFAVRVS